MTRLVFTHEWNRLLRSPRLLLPLGLVALILALTTGWSASTDARQNAVQLAAAEEARADWLGRGAANPHGMAHYGDYVFRPNGALARLDGGVQATLGRVLRIEGHRRGMPLSTATAEAGPLARFGRFDPAFLLHDIVPLILILVGVGLVAEGRRGCQTWMLAHGARGWTLVLGRTAFLASIAAVLLSIVVLTTLLASSEPLAAGDIGRLAGLVATYSIFLLTVAALVVVASSLARSSTAATFALIGLWLLGTTVLPRATATLASALAPLPSRDAFETAMREARSEGLDAHNAEDRRLADMEAQLMAEHGVTTREELPVNFDGIAMQVDEEVGNAVWDEHFGRLEQRLHRQGRVAKVAALLNPFQGVRADLRGLALVALALLYTALWAGVLTATAVAARNRREAALAYGGVWVVLVVLAPALLSERALSATAESAGLTAALDQRARQYDGYDEEAGDLLARLYAARGELRAAPAAALETLPPEIERHVYDWSRVRGLVADDEELTAAQRRAIAGAERQMIWSPTVTLTLAVERLAGRDLHAAMTFRRGVVAAVAERTDWVVEQAWRHSPLTLGDFETLLETAPAAVEAEPAGVTPHLIVLLGWTALAWTVGVVRVRRREREL